jgi:Mrp family chromosome partitioning ATPase
MQGLPDILEPVPPRQPAGSLFDELSPSLQWERMPVANTKPPRIYTLGELVTRPHTEVPCLLNPLLPRQGLAVLAGASDTGKSAILRQLALAVATGAQTFLDFPLNTQQRTETKQ